MQLLTFCNYLWYNNSYRRKEGFLYLKSVWHDWPGIKSLLPAGQFVPWWPTHFLLWLLDDRDLWSGLQSSGPSDMQLCQHLKKERTCISHMYMCLYLLNPGSGHPLSACMSFSPTIFHTVKVRRVEKHVRVYKSEDIQIEIFIPYWKLRLERIYSTVV